MIESRMIDPENYDKEFPLDEFNRLSKEYNDHIGTIRNKSLLRMVRVCQMMNLRYYELLCALAAPPGEHIIKLETQEDFQEFITNLDEKILLATASMISCIDYLKKVSGWEESEVFIAIQKEFDTLLKEPNIAFLKRLRHYLNSYGLFPWKIDSFTSRIMIDKTILLNWGGWNLSDKKIINDLDIGVIPIEVIIHNYGSRSAEFWDDAFKRLTETNAPELEQADLIRIQMNDMLLASSLPTIEEWKEDQKNTSKRRIIL